MRYLQVTRGNGQVVVAFSWSSTRVCVFGGVSIQGQGDGENSTFAMLHVDPILEAIHLARVAGSSVANRSKIPRVRSMLEYPNFINIMSLKIEISHWYIAT